MSGEQLTIAHEPRDPTARQSCIRGSTRGGRRRAASQIAQAQFHCGTPPPAALPSRRARTLHPPRRPLRPLDQLSRPRGRP